MMDKRQQAERLGRRAEGLAALWLRLKGYRLLARRVRTAQGEIDLVMRRGRLLIFVEVKARASVPAAMDALTPRGLDRLRRAALLLAPRFDPAQRLNHRFDAVLIAPGAFPRHIIGITAH